MSCAVPTGPLMPRSGYRASRSSSRPSATSSSSATLANRLPSVVAWAATLCERPAITSASYSAARRASRTSTASTLVRTSSSAERTCNCSTFSVRSRLVMPRWISSWPVGGQGVELLDPGLHVVPGHPLPGGDRGQVDRGDARRPPPCGRPAARRPGSPTPSSRWACSTASHSCRSSTHLVLRAEDLAIAGGGVAVGQDVGDRRAWLVTPACLRAGHRAMVYRTGRRLVRSGSTVGAGHLGCGAPRPTNTLSTGLDFRWTRCPSAAANCWPLPPSARSVRPSSARPRPGQGHRNAAEHSFRLTVLGTTDTHGNVLNWDYFKDAEYDDAQHNDVGLAKISTLVNAMRRRAGPRARP